MNGDTKHFVNGLIKENPVFVLLLGTCPTLATTTSVVSALAMGLAAAAVLICSNCVISLLRKVIPDKVRIPAYIVIIAGFVTMVQMIMEAYLPSLYEMLGVYLALIVVNCIVLGRAEMFASKNKLLPSLMDGAGMGLGFTAALILMATVREVFGAGSFAGTGSPFIKDYTVPILASPPGGFFVFGMLIALMGVVTKKPLKRDFGCDGCPNSPACRCGCNEKEKAGA